MALGDIKGEQCFDVLAEITAPVLRLSQDERMTDLFSGKGAPKGVDPKKYAADKMSEALPSILKDYKDDFVIILAALSGKTKEEYVENLSFSTLLNDIFSLLTDQSFKAFLF